jgi:hypothetical protein
LKKPPHYKVDITGIKSRYQTRTARFIELLDNIPAFVPLSGVTMEFDANGRRVAGSQAR